VLKKTAWYSFIHPMRIGALLAGAADDLNRFNRFGFLLGAAFQIQDDVLNLTGDLHRYGKEIGGDLWEGKRTLILVHAFDNIGPTDRRWLERLFFAPRERRLPRELDMANDLLQSSGSIDWARAVSADLAAAAVSEFDVAFAGASDGPDRTLVRTLADFVATRNL
jgi:geranylgeranyl pyrophosphate synthase